MVKRSRRRGAAKWAAVRAKADGGAADGQEDDLDPPPSPGDASYYQDKVDDFHEARSRAALAQGWNKAESGDEEDEEEEEEVLALDVADEDDEEGESEEEEDEEDGGSSDQSEEEADPSLSWGQRKKLYYDTDYGGSKRRGRRSQEEVEEEEREEEEEAQLIQRRLAQALQEDDFGVTWVEAFAAKPAPQAVEAAQAETHVARDLAKVSVKEKLKLLRKESPELLELLEDLRAKLTEARDELEPLLQLAERGVIPAGPGSRYLRAKYNLYLSYCANIAFYLVLKARRVPASGHPVIERLVAYRGLINRLAPVDEKLAPEIRHLLAPKDEAGKPEAAPKARPARPKPRAAVASAVPAEDSDLDEEAARRHYKEMEAGLKLKRKKEEDGADGQALEEPSAKRAITYQIAKNRGLTPRRKKIDRNPRVKHREKFRRAKIRRRGQVREVRREEQRYSGELSGIRAGVKKSIKLR